MSIANCYVNINIFSQNVWPPDTPRDTAETLLFSAHAFKAGNTARCVIGTRDPFGFGPLAFGF